MRDPVVQLSSVARLPLHHAFCVSRGPIGIVCSRLGAEEPDHRQRGLMHARYRWPDRHTEPAMNSRRRISALQKFLASLSWFGLRGNQALTARVGRRGFCQRCPVVGAMRTLTDALARTAHDPNRSCYSPLFDHGCWKGRRQRRRRLQTACVSSVNARRGVGRPVPPTCWPYRGSEP
jgi:hypothetical protein